MATKIKLREKPISGGRKSLYLDYYPPIPHPSTGEPTRREFLGMYIFAKTKKPLDKQHNEQTKLIAEQIRQKREKEFNGNEALTTLEKKMVKREQKIEEQGQRDFVRYFKELAYKRKGSNHDNWTSALKHLEKYSGSNLKFEELNEVACEGFREHLIESKKLSRNSAHSYFNKFKAALKQAYKEGILQTDLNSRVSAIKQEETKREFLTVEELNSLIKTDCKSPILKKAALFSSLTGLRFSDVQKLTWDEIRYIKGKGYQMRYRQKKTNGEETLWIPDQAYEILGKPGKDGEQVFQGLTYSAFHNRHLYQWISAAGITKDITFHCFRHTFATLQLMEKTDIVTVSKMLGHKNLKTTMVYTKVVDELKREAAGKIKLDLG